MRLAGVPQADLCLGGVKLRLLKVSFLGKRKEDVGKPISFVDQRFVEQRVVLEVDVPQETTILVAVVVFWVGLQADSLTLDL